MSAVAGRFGPVAPRALRGLAPRACVGLALLLCVAASAATGVAPLAGLLGCALALALATGRLADLPTLRLLAGLNLFLALLWLTVAVDWGSRGLDPAGVVLASVLTLRANAILLGVRALLGGLDAWQLAAALRSFGLPERLALLVALTARYVQMYARTWQRLDRAARARGFRPRADRATLRIYGELLAALVAAALVRGRRIEWAMRARGFDGSARGFLPPAPGAGAGADGRGAAARVGALIGALIVLSAVLPVVLPAWLG